MTPTTIVELSDVVGNPRVKLTLPTTAVQVGTRLKLHFQLRRQHNGRFEVLDIIGEFRVSGLLLDTTGANPHNIIHVEAIGKAPAWRAVKKPATPKRRLALARSPRTPIL